VYKLSIGAVCELKWPKDRIIVQVLDDSTDPYTKVHTCQLLFVASLEIFPMLNYLFGQNCLYTSTFVASCNLPLLFIYYY
jgi:hypothetical protein